MSLLAGKYWQHGQTDGIGSTATFQSLSSVAVDASLNVYVCANYLRKVAVSGVVSTIDSSSSYNGVAVVSGKVYVSDSVAYTHLRQTMRGRLLQELLVL